MVSTNDPLYKIQLEISEAKEKEQELKKWQNILSSDFQKNKDSRNSLPSNGHLKSQFSDQKWCHNQTARTFAPIPGQKGIMERFLKSRGRLSDSVTFSSDIGKMVAVPKVQISTEKQIRRGYVPVQEKIQEELREMQNREAELRAFRHNFSENSGSFESNSSDTLPTSTVKLRTARSMAHLLDSSDDYLDNMNCKLRPTVSLVHLCDGLEEDSVPSSSQLIAQFENIIQQNREKPSNL